MYVFNKKGSKYMKWKTELEGEIDKFTITLDFNTPFSVVDARSSFKKSVR